MKTVIACVFSLFAFAVTADLSFAQEGCQTTLRSCSKIYQRCESNCQNRNDPGACVARICSPAVVGCRANGVWKASAATACWKTNKRS